MGNMSKRIRDAMKQFEIALATADEDNVELMEALDSLGTEVALAAAELLNAVAEEG